MSVPRAWSVGEGHPSGVSFQPLTAAPFTAAYVPELRARGVSEAAIRRLARGGKPSKHRTCLMRLTVFPRDDFTCQECGWQPDLPPPPGWDGAWTLGGPAPAATTYRELRFCRHRLLTLGHITPATEGGKFEEANLRAECSRCNYGGGSTIRAAHDRGLTLAGDPWR